MTLLDIALLVMRIVLGMVFIFHGGQKLFGWFGGQGTAGLAGMLSQQGVAYAGLLSRVAALSEFGGGVLILVGLFTPLAAALIISTMLVAIVAIHFKNGFSNMEQGYEYNLSLIGLALPLLLVGPGAISVDHGLGYAMPLNQLPVWSVVFLVLVMLGGVLSMQLFKTIGPQTN